MKSLLVNTFLVMLSLLMVGCAATLKDVSKWQMEGPKGVPLLIKVAEDPKADIDVRLAAAKALGTMGDSNAVQPLLNIALSDQDSGLREEAVNALIAIGRPASKALIEIAVDSESDVKLRLVAMKALSAMGDTGAVQPLLDIALADKDRDMRDAAVNELITIGEPATEALAKMAEAPKADVDLRLAAAKALDEMGLREAAVNSYITIGRPASKALIEIAVDSESDVDLRLAATKALGTMGDASAVQPLLDIALLDRDSSSMREAAINALITIGEPATEALAKVAEAPKADVDLRLAAAKALDEMGLREAAVNSYITIGRPASKALIKVAGDGESDVELRLASAKALDEMGLREAAVNSYISIGRPASKALIEIAVGSESDVDLRLAAAKALDEMGLREAAVNSYISIGRPASKALIKVAGDRESDVKLRLAAAKALVTIGDSNAVQPLLNIALSKQDSGLCEEAVNALITIGRPASKALIEVAGNSEIDLKLRFAAVKALGDIGDADAVQPLLGIAFVDKDSSMREAAVNALIGIGEPATEALVKVTENAQIDAKLRLAAESALRDMRVQKLITQLRDPDGDVRIAASTQLSKMGEKLSQSQIDQLVDIMKNGREEWSRYLYRESHCTWYEDTTVKYYAANALMNIRSLYVTSKVVADAKSARSSGKSKRRKTDPGWI